MTSEQWQQVKELFEAALEYGPNERKAFLEQACRRDEEVRSEVESLLAAHERDAVFMSKPIGNLLPDVEPVLVESQSFGPYEELAPLGEGGMGQVYLAVDTRLGRKVALKLLPPRFTNDPDRVHRFEQEARATSALNHPNIVTIHEIGEFDSVHFIATEFIDGATLREHLATGEMSLDQVLDIAAQVSSALAAAHEAGVVHRDIKPENIMLRRDGFVKVLDFGLAKLAFQSITKLEHPFNSKTNLKTDPGMVMGTVHYMSPEQARGEEMDSRTDIWSLGVVLYEMLTGRVPFNGETPSHVVVSILETELPTPSRYVELPAQVEQIVLKMLSKKREERYQTASHIAVELNALRQELEVEARLKRLTN